MGKKYIIEILDDCPSEFKGIIALGLTQEKQISVEMIPEESLRPYTEPDLEQVRKEAYAQGLVDGNGVRKSEINTAYQHGLSDMWETARKIYLPVEYGGIPADALRQMFDNKTTSGIFKKVSASEAIEKIRQYEQEKAKVEYNFEKVKDVIETTANEYNMSLDEIAAVLQKMRESK